MGWKVDTVGNESGGDQAVGSPSSEESALRLVEEFAGFGPSYMRWVRSRMGERGLTYARMRLMRALHCHGPQIMTSISDELGVTRRNVTALVDALEEEGQVRRTAHPSDRRATVIELTERGSERMNRTYHEHPASVAELFETLSPEDRSHLVRILGALRDELREREFG